MDDLSTLNKKITDLKQAKKFEEALEYVDEANKIKKEAKSPDFWYKRGLHFCDLGEYETALDCFDKDLTLYQKSYETFFAKGKVLFELQKYAEAVECFNKAAEEHHLCYLQNNKKAEQLKKVHKYEKAIIYTDLASESQLDDDFWYYNGLALLKLKKYDEASASFTKSLGIKNSAPKVLYALSKCELLAGNEKNCLSILEKACKLDPSNKEKLRVDVDFFSLSENKQFRIIRGL